MKYQTKTSSTNYLNKVFLNQDCVIVTALETIQGRWTTQVLVCVKMGQNRFGLIKEKLPGITDNVLGLRLNHLVDNNLIVKTQLGTEKIYQLTETGEGLVKVLEELAKWEQKRQGSSASKICFK